MRKARGEPELFNRSPVPLPLFLTSSFPHPVPLSLLAAPARAQYTQHIVAPVIGRVDGYYTELTVSSGTLSPGTLHMTYHYLNGVTGAPCSIAAYHFRNTPPRPMRTARTAPESSTEAIDQVGSTLTPIPALTISSMPSVSCR